MEIKAGDIVETDFSVYKHYAVVSDRICSKGYPMLISASRRNGTVKEEPWDRVTGGKETKLVRKCKSREEAYSIIEKARSEVDKWQYSMVKRNCEHFVNWAVTGELSSKQVRNGLVGGGLGVAGVALSSENPKVAKIILGGLVCAMLAVALTNPKI